MVDVTYFNAIEDPFGDTILVMGSNTSVVFINLELEFLNAVILYRIVNEELSYKLVDVAVTPNYFVVTLSNSTAFRINVIL